jgi:hypothetical protein
MQQYDLGGHFMTIKSTNPVAFALGGLAGGNGFGAGFLDAARFRGIRPSAISCTSGMIVWAARFLAGEDLAARFRQELTATPAGVGVPPPVASAWMGVAGLAGVFRPATQEYWTRWFRLPTQPLQQELANRVLPVQTALSVRPDSFYQEVAQALNDTDVAVLFNAFCPPSGCEFLFLNPAAMRLLNRSPGQRQGNQVFQSIDVPALRAALHLYAYGHEELYDGQHLVDGAYHRQFIVDELCELPGAAKPAALWLVRPQNSRWLDAMPSNFFEQRDMETEIAMNSSYASQVRRIELINRLLKSGQLTASGRYQPVVLNPFEFSGQRGYFDYFHERQDVFDRAREDALAVLT